MCLPELNLCNSTAEEEYKIKGYIQVHAEECLDSIIEFEEVQEKLDDCEVNMKRASQWIEDYLNLPDDRKTDQKAIDLLTTALNTLRD
mgnify:CR=1 FL=1